MPVDPCRRRELSPLRKSLSRRLHLMDGSTGPKRPSHAFRARVSWQSASSQPRSLPAPPDGPGPAPAAHQPGRARRCKGRSTGASSRISSDSLEQPARDRTQARSRPPGSTGPGPDLRRRLVSPGLPGHRRGGRRNCLADHGSQISSAVGLSAACRPRKGLHLPPLCGMPMTRPRAPGGQPGMGGLHDREVVHDVVREGRTLRVAMSTWSDRSRMEAATQPSVAWRISR